MSAEGVEAQSLTVVSDSTGAWWHALGSARLDALVDEGLANNHDVSRALANLDRARHLSDAFRANTLPQVDLTASSGHVRYGAAFLGDQAKDFAPYSYYAMGPTVSYDFDLFGRIRRSVERSDALAELKVDELDAVTLNVSGDIVNEVVSAASTRAQLDLLRSMLVSNEARLHITEISRSKGGATQVELEEQRRAIDQVDSEIAIAQQRLATTQDALAILVGRTPGKWTAPDIGLEELHLPHDIPLMLPSALVRQRPDIRAAEAGLHAESAQIGVATANMYPDIALTGSLSAEGLFAGPSELAWQALGGISAPVFEGGRLRAQKQAAEAGYQAALAQYHQVVLKAFAEVADSLNMLSNDATLDAAVSQSTESARRTEELNKIAYARGASSFTEMLQSTDNRQLFELKRVQIRGRRLADSARLMLVTAGTVHDGNLGTASR
ncbi:efflux transporter outer membrane subunit (plasmid) [Paraburkholderia sp. 22B1P]|nr:efflux transporter outer membrane subunit [Paraburkholderia sp. 22B1P]